MNRLAEKTALVTGAASGIGAAISRAFAEQGARVLAVDIDGPGLEHLSDSAPDQIHSTIADVTDEAAMEAVASEAIALLGGLDILVANAGRGSFGPIIDTDPDEWRSVLDLCLTGVFLTMRSCGPIIRDGGSIITISSLNAIQPAAGMSAYCAAKAGTVALTRVAAMEFGERRIRANSIAPGLVRTAASRPFWDLPGVVDEFIENTTVGRFAEATDVAKLAVFLASDDAEFISGSVHSVDGGASTKRYPDLFAAIDRLHDSR